MRLAFRVGGLLLGLGALGMGISIVLMATRANVNEAPAPGAAALMLTSATLLLLALPAVFAAQAERAGILGLLAHVLLTIGLLLLVLVAALPLAVPGFTGPYAENAVFFLFGIALALGLLLTAIAALRARVFPRGAGALLLVAMATFVFAFFIAEELSTVFMQLGTAAFAILLVAGFGWFGAALWRLADDDSPRPSATV